MTPASPGDVTPDGAYYPDAVALAALLEAARRSAGRPPAERLQAMADEMMAHWGDNPRRLAIELDEITNAVRDGR